MPHGLEVFSLVHLVERRREETGVAQPLRANTPVASIPVESAVSAPCPACILKQCACATRPLRMRAITIALSGIRQALPHRCHTQGPSPGCVTRRRGRAVRLGVHEQKGRRDQGVEAFRSGRGHHGSSGLPLRYTAPSADPSDQQPRRKAHRLRIALPILEQFLAFFCLHRDPSECPNGRTSTNACVVQASRSLTGRQGLRPVPALRGTAANRFKMGEK